MRRRGVVYDTGIVFSGPGWKVNSRPALDANTARRELQIIRDDLHCNAVRVTGRDLGRLLGVAGAALLQGLEVWLSPALFEHTPEQTLRFFAAAAVRAERLRRRFPEQVVLVLGGELTLFMRGIVPGRSVAERAGNAMSRARAGDQSANDRLNAFLGRASEAVRGVYHGPLTYASLAGETVDWSRFDLIGVDHYRDARVKGRYVEMLQPLEALGKPVVVTEFGMRTYRGAERAGGALGFGIVDQKTVFLHQLPLIGRFVRRRLNGSYVRDEDLQARELSETLTVLDAAGVDGAFVSEFVTPEAPFSEDPRYDLDMSALSLVKTLPHGQHGTRYPDLDWEPKAAFDAVGAFYAAR